MDNKLKKKHANAKALKYRTPLGRAIISCKVKNFKSPPPPLAGSGLHYSFKGSYKRKASEKKGR